MVDTPRGQYLDFDLGERLTCDEGWVYMTGMQALVRLPVQQAKRDAAAGLNTGGYISGYRGSPIGRYDMELWQAEKQLADHNIVFQPGVNEDIAATATWGSQMVGLFPGAKVEGVFSIWYGKAPGMDRSMDPIRHASFAGSNEKGGSLLLVGDDHGAKSSTVACYSDFNFVSAGIPLLAPANAQEVLDFGLHGIALSRFSGCLAGLKLVTDVVESGGSIYVGPDSPAITLPEKDKHFGITPFLPVPEQERQLYDIRLGMALEYIRANGLNHISGASDASIGIVAAGKAWQDLNQALNDMGVDDGRVGKTGLRLLKVGAVWPLDDRILREFADGLDTIIVVEEKRPFLEDQIRALLYGMQNAPRIIGKQFDSQFYAATKGETAFPAVGEIEPVLVARIIGRVIREQDPGAELALSNQPEDSICQTGGALRPPSFCAGCPHGRSTQVPDGSRALAGIGCHTMAVFRDPSTTNSITQMGGEGAAWFGQAPFTDEDHVFANMGDGTYFHSGLMAIRAAVAADVNITYKLLHNGFVSMTGGQPVDGDLDPLTMAGQLLAEGVGDIALVTDDVDKYRDLALPAGISLHPRESLGKVQRDMRRVTGVTAIIYDQPCATERRRLRKRGKWADPDKRVFINPAVCEGCGDCSTVSACMAIEPLETEFGRKRQINQTSCNKDFSCVEGFCPSIVTVSGVTPRKAQTAHTAIDISDVLDPVLPEIDGSWAILISGIGGAGVVTIGQTLAVAAHVDGWYSSNLDITGLAQKYGAVHSHIKIATSPDAMAATRIAAGEANALIGCDLVVAAGDDSLSKLRLNDTLAVSDTTVVPTSEFSRNPDWQLDGKAQIDRLSSSLGDNMRAIDAQDLAGALLGDSVYANMILLGASWQQGALPLARAAIMRAIELNGAKIPENKRAFDLGRLVYANPDRVADMVKQASGSEEFVTGPDNLDDLIAHRSAALVDYQNEALAKRYRDLVARVRQAATKAGLDDGPAIAAARYYYKLLAVKDAWEVARLYTAPAFRQALSDSFDGTPDITFYFGARPVGGIDPNSGEPVKGRVQGRIAMVLFGLLNRFRGLRGTWMDPFRGDEEAVLGRTLLAQYEQDIETALSIMDAGNADTVTALLSLPEQVRGYGHVRARHATEMAALRENILANLENPARAAA